jgi:hypothetical protein
VLQFKLELVESFLEPLMKRQAQLVHFGMWFEIVDYHTGQKLSQVFWRMSVAQY